MARGDDGRVVARLEGGRPKIDQLDRILCRRQPGYEMVAVSLRRVVVIIRRYSGGWAASSPVGGCTTRHKAAGEAPVAARRLQTATANADAAAAAAAPTWHVAWDASDVGTPRGGAAGGLPPPASARTAAAGHHPSPPPAFPQRRAKKKKDPSRSYAHGMRRGAAGLGGRCGGGAGRERAKRARAVDGRVLPPRQLWRLSARPRSRLNLAPPPASRGRVAPRVGRLPTQSVTPAQSPPRARARVCE